MSEKPYISVIVPTTRVGGLDVLFDGLNSQLFDDFELVLVDALHAYRGDLIREKSTSHKFSITHVAPFGYPFPLSAFCRYSNTGLVHARGSIVVFLSDYTWISPQHLSYHASFHQNHSNSGLLCPHEYYLPPSIHPSFGTYADSQRSYNTQETERYATDVREGKLNHLMWSLFEKPYETGDIMGLRMDPEMEKADPKLADQALISNLPGPFFPFFAKNESCPLEALLQINGWDEDLDGTNCCQDLDLADRLNKQADIPWTSVPWNRVSIVNPRHVFPCPIRLRSHLTNGDIWFQKRIAGYPNPVNLWNLRDIRRRLGVD